MRRLIFILFLFLTPLSSNEQVYQKTQTQQNVGSLYLDYGRFNYNFADGTYIRIHAYVWKRLNMTGYYPHFKYEYILTAKSESWNGRRITETWLYNNRIYLGNQEISAHQFPYGLTSYIQTNPTAVYSWFTSEEHIDNFTMAWANAVHENR